MDEFLNFSAAPIPAAQPKQKPQKSSKISASVRRKVSQSSVVYGEELFKAAWKPAKSIVICFWPYTKNMIRVSKDEHKGRFAIEFRHAGDFMLYHFEPALEWEFPLLENGDFDRSIELNLPEPARIYGPFETAKEITLRIINILRNEVLADKKAIIEELKEREAFEKAEHERIADEKEQIEDQLAEAGILSDVRSNITEADIEGIQSAKEKNIKVEKKENDDSERAKIITNGKGATLKLTPIIY